MWLVFGLLVIIMLVFIFLVKLIVIDKVLVFFGFGEIIVGKLLFFIICLGMVCIFLNFYCFNVCGINIIFVL